MSWKEKLNQLDQTESLCPHKREGKKKKKKDQTEVKEVVEVLRQSVLVVCRRCILFPLGVPWAEQSAWFSWVCGLWA